MDEEGLFYSIPCGELMTVVNKEQSFLLQVEPLSREELCSRLGLEQQGGPLLLQLLHPPQQPPPLPAPQSPEAASRVEVAVPEVQTQSGMLDVASARHEGLADTVLGGPRGGGGGGRLPPLSSAPRVPPSSLEAPPALPQPEKDPHSLQSTASLWKTEGSGSEDSVEEELSHLDDSSFSTTADDRTMDQTVSRSSDVEGCDYAEPAHEGR
ncbi:hypothetical protein V5799_025252 [Amblyomma americanum]|uniref:Uncharacterized protein n=1 Tax=Amblyomma americanum TaxID=6943 RepID=A0AAQ4E9U5_AMBAM